MNSAPSPFLPGTTLQYAWDSTSLGWAKTCWRLYYYHMIEGWKPKGEGIHLIFGQWYHKALENYDKLRVSGETHDDALCAVVHEAMIWTWDKGEVDETGDYIRKPGPWVSDHNLKTRETLIRTIIWYIDQFKDDPAKTIVLASGKPALELSFRMELGTYTPGIPDQNGYMKPGPQYILCGHLDRVVEFAGGNYVMDRKTASTTLGSYYFDQYSPDNQMSLYTVAAQVIYHTPVKGIIIDAAQIAVGFSRFARGFTYRTEAEINEWIDETRWWIKQAEQRAAEGYYPRNDKSCHQYGGCTFRKVCSKSPEVRQKFLESDYERRPWNPLEVR